jgi:TnpA family transposase
MACGTLLAVSSRTGSDGHLVCHNPPFVASPLLKDEDRMRQHLTPQELDEHFTVLPQEHTLLAQKSPVQRLGCAILLKYFQWEGRFPTAWHDVPRAVIRHLAERLGVPVDSARQYDLEGRLARYHKGQIRHWMGFRPGTTADAEAIKAWVCTHTRIDEVAVPQLLSRLADRYKQLKIELPTSSRLERLAHSALQTVDGQFFTTLAQALPPETRALIDAMLTETSASLSLTALKADPGGHGLETLLTEVEKLLQLQHLTLPHDLLTPLSARYLRRIKLRVATETLHELRRHPESIRHALLALFCYVRTQEITDTLIEVFLRLIHHMGASAEKRVDQVLLADFKRVMGKPALLFRMAAASLAQPEGQVKEVIYPVVGEQTLQDLVTESQASGRSYSERVHRVMRGTYSHHYRRMVPRLLSALVFATTNAHHQPVLAALDLMQQYAGSKRRFYGAEDDVPLHGVVPREWRELVLEQDPKGHTRVNRINYEMATLHTLRERVRCKEIWVKGAQRYRNPNDDLPADFAAERVAYYQALEKPLDADTFIADLQQQMDQALQMLDTGMPQNPLVKILQRPRGWIRLSPSERKPDPLNLTQLKAEILQRWPMTSLLDVLKETDLRVHFTQCFPGMGTRTMLDRDTLQRRLLLCLFGLGTNTGLKRVCTTMTGDQFHDLLYVRRRYLHPDALRNAIAHVANAIFRIRAPHIWGEGTTACASDSKQFGTWDQNLLTEWHVRYGRPGIMVYWHVEKRSVCIYSQLKTVSSSEVAAMIEGLLRHGTEMTVEKNYVDSHGQSAVAFAFCHLLNFQLLPRLKGIHRQKLSRPTTGQPDAYPHLQAILTRPIRWERIHHQYDTMMQYATALRLGTADAQTILKRFTRSNYQHPTYRAIVELGKAVKTIFLCRFLHNEDLRQEIHDGLQVIENWNSANEFIFYGRGGDMATNRLEDQEMAMLALHLLQISLVYINTLMVQQIFTDETWFERMTSEDFRALTPLTYAHINPYGKFELDMQQRLHLDAA